MEAQLVLKEWQIKQSKIAGKYAVMCGDKEIAEQPFNEGYQSKALTFSEATMKKVAEAEAAIVAEIEGLLK